MVKEVNLRNLFFGLQQQMLATARTNAEVITHPGTAGDAGELNWRDMLGTYLPHRYQVTSGFVVDSTGQISEQQDVIVYDRQYSPFLFHQAGAVYVPAESVYAVFEVKPELTKGHVEYAGKKANSVRALFRTSVEIPHAGGTFPKKEPHEIIGGILATKSTWIPPFGDAFQQTIASLAVGERLNVGAALNDGGFVVQYPDGTPVIETSSANAALMFFFLRLLKYLQQIATVPAIDFEAYEKSLG